MQLKTIATVAGTITAVAAALAVFGVKDIPRPAWSGELKALAGEVVTLKSEVTAQQLEAAKFSWFRNKRQQAEYADHEVPNFLLEEQSKLETLMGQLEAELEDLRGGDGG